MHLLSFLFSSCDTGFNCYGTFDRLDKSPPPKDNQGCASLRWCASVGNYVVHTTECYNGDQVIPTAYYFSLPPKMLHLYSCFPILANRQSGSTATTCCTTCSHHCTTQASATTTGCPSPTASNGHSVCTIHRRGGG